MKKSFYNADSLGKLLAKFEATYGLTSAEFWQLHAEDRVPEAITGVNRHAWATTYRDVQRLRQGFPERASATLHLTA